MPGRNLAECSGHDDAPAYVVCTHVDQGAPVEYIDDGEDDESGIGAILCGSTEPNDHPVDQLYLICEKCAQEKGWLDGEDEAR